MVRVLRIPLPKEKLQKLSPEERSLLFILGYAQNQINMLTKLVTFSSNKDGDTEIEQLLSGSQTQMLARIAIGVIHETWILIRERIIESSTGKTYLPLLDQKGKAALAKLQTLVDESKLLAKLRNNFVFHIPNDKMMDKGFELAIKNPGFKNEWNWYFSDALMNTSFFPSDIVVLHGMMTLSGETDLVEAQKKLWASSGRSTIR